MAKNVAVIAFNPVNGLGLFQYLEAFFENEIPYNTFAIADTKEIKTNSGINITLDGTIADLNNRVDEFDALVFSCGDGMMDFIQNNNSQYYQDMFSVMKAFGDKGKILVGHCAGAGMFDAARVIDGVKIAVHPLGKENIQHAIATDDKVVIDGNVYTAQREDYVWMFMRKLIKALKED